MNINAKNTDTAISDGCICERTATERDRTCPRMLKGGKAMETTAKKEYELAAERNHSEGFVEKPLFDVVKRVMDVVCSLLALVVLSPILLITAIAIFIDDPGPILFKQERVGRNGKFMVYKFRSMVKNAESIKEELKEQNQDQGANFKIDHDPRITRVGRILRKTSIDELPQLINILKGDMAIIGPRPFIEEEQRLLPDDRLQVLRVSPAIGRSAARTI